MSDFLWHSEPYAIVITLFFICWYRGNAEPLELHNPLSRHSSSHPCDDSLRRTERRIGRDCEVWRIRAIQGSWDCHHLLSLLEMFWIHQQLLQEGLKLQWEDSVPKEAFFRCSVAHGNHGDFVLELTDFKYTHWRKLMCCRFFTWKRTRLDTCAWTELLGRVLQCKEAHASSCLYLCIQAWLGLTCITWVSTRLSFKIFWDRRFLGKLYKYQF
jgi:hypothetical protein